MRVYISAPLNTGNMIANIRRACIVAKQLISMGHSPYVPHLFPFLDLFADKDYETWMRVVMEYLGVCDAMIRLDGESPGADREERFAQEKHIPVYLGIKSFLCSRTTIVNWSPICEGTVTGRHIIEYCDHDFPKETLWCRFCGRVYAIPDDWKGEGL
jgi:uncharacterized protein YbaR (Trm112 family)